MRYTKVKTIGVILFPFILSGCIARSTIEDSSEGHSFERLTCVDSREDKMTFVKDYKLVFFARNFSQNVQVWLQPKSGKTMVTKTHHRYGKTCYIFNGFPTEMLDR